MTAQLLRPPGRWRWSWTATQITLMAGCTGLAGVVTGLNLGLASLLERQTHNIFFDMRGTVAPQGVVILAIDDASINSGEPGTESWPWPRANYATVIDRLLAAGAHSVGLDLILDTPSVYGPADDQRLAAALAQAGDRVVLATQVYAEDDLTGALTPDVADQPSAGSLWGVNPPIPAFLQQAPVGLINMPQAADGRVHSLGQVFVEAQQANLTDMETILSLDAEHTVTIEPFADALLHAAQRDYPPPRGNDIYFHGPAQTFRHIPIWQVLNDDTWERNLGGGQIFENQIVLIGGTAPMFQDEHATPFARYFPTRSLLTGVEIQANAIATLESGRAIGMLFSRSRWDGLYVVVVLSGVGVLFFRSQRPLHQAGIALGAIVVIMGVGYGLFTWSYRQLPAAVPSMGVVAIGVTQITAGAVREQIRRQQLRRTLKQYAALPIVQEIISQQEDMKDLLLEREAEIFGKILGRRYRVVKVLGAGGFSETYIAEDLQRPSHPACVVKRLRLISDKPNMLKLMRRLFLVEAETLERLGEHSQIPALLAYFEEDEEFFLVQELINGRSLHHELSLRGLFPPTTTVRLLVDLLTVLKFVHRQNVIHRDIKPVNIMRRTADGKLILIDFGIAKKIENQLTELEENVQFTIGLGTRGYMPQEQAAGMPNFTSDLFALGMTAIETLTALPPSQLPFNNRGEPDWMSLTPQISPALRSLLAKMTHYDHKQRYQSVSEVFQALQQVPEFQGANLPPSTIPVKTPAPNQSAAAAIAPAAVDADLEEASADTQAWRPEPDATIGHSAGLDELLGSPAETDAALAEASANTQVWDGHTFTPKHTDAATDTEVGTDTDVGLDLDGALSPDQDDADADLLAASASTQIWPNADAAIAPRGRDPLHAANSPVAPAAIDAPDPDLEVPTAAWSELETGAVNNVGLDRLATEPADAELEQAIAATQRWSTIQDIPPQAAQAADVPEEDVTPTEPINPSDRPQSRDTP